MSSQEAVHVCRMEVTPTSGKGLWALGGFIFSAVVGHRADKSRTHAMELSCEQTHRSRGVCVPALEPRGEGEGLRTRYQGFKPDLGNSAVRHYRGASETVAMAELRTHLATERVSVVTLRLTQARPSSIPTIDTSMRAVALFSQVRTDGASVPALLLAPQVPSTEYRIGRIATRLAPRKELNAVPSSDSIPA
jgi:hypothetical protein